MSKIKKITALVIGMMMLLTMVSCSKQPSELPEGMALLESDAADFLFYYPQGWTADRNDGMLSAYVSPVDRSNVSVTSFPADWDTNTLDDYLTKSAYFDDLKATFSDFEMITDGEETTLGGVPARQYVFTATAAGESYKFRQIMAFLGNYVYVMTYTSTADTFDAHTDEVNRVVEEFRFK